jgi:hypothetical protein
MISDTMKQEQCSTCCDLWIPAQLQKETKSIKQQGGNRDIGAEVGARGNHLEAVHLGMLT